MENNPKIKTKLPGPKAQKVITQDRVWTSPSYNRQYPLVVKKAKGVMIEDLDGNQFLDFTAGAAVVSTGHTHGKIIEAIRKASEKYIHVGNQFVYSPVLAELAKQVCNLCGDSKNKVFFGNSGAEAIECAIKIARNYTKRPALVSFIGAFHGRTLGTLSLSSNNSFYRQNFASFISDIYHVPYPYCYRCPYNLKYPTCNIHCANVIEDEYFAKLIPPTNVAAVVIETIQGEAGYIVPPLEFYKKLEKICKNHGILLIADEIQCGVGRTGKWLAIEHYRISPDIIALSKGLASGLPLSATIAKDKLMTWKPGSHGTTFGGNPIASAAALATVKLLKNNLMKNAFKVGTYILNELKKLQRRYDLIGDVRGIGLMIGVELVRDHNTKERAHLETNLFLQKSFRKGLLLLKCGDNTIRITPPLTVSIKDAAIALSLIEETLNDVKRAKQAARVKR